MDDDLVATLQRLEKEELSLLESRTLVSESSLAQSSRDVERCLEGVRRALPELDIVSKTAGELRTSIKKTMERADVVSVKVRELDQSRSRALEALQYANRCLEARSCLEGAKQALNKKALEHAAGYVKRFDDISKGDQLPGSAEMQIIRGELEKSILESHPSSDLGSPTQTQQIKKSFKELASGTDWLETSAIKEALKQASIMSKVGDSTHAETKYAHFLASYLKDRILAECERVGIYEDGSNTIPSDDSKVFVDTLKYLFNSSAALIETNLRIPETILTKNARPVIFKIINAECDRQCSILFDNLISSRRLHERAGRQENDLPRLNHLLIEICIAMQHVETYDRYVRSKSAYYISKEYNPEYRRIISEVAGAYSLLENNWVTESFKRAKRAETHVDVAISSGKTLQASSLVEDSFYICRKAIKRSLGTGSSDAACACINLIMAFLEDTLLPSFHILMESSTNIPSVQINSLELCSEYCLKIHQQTIRTEAFERDEDLQKVIGCAETLLERSNQFDSKKNEILGVVLFQTLNTLNAWKTCLEAIEQVSYQLDEETFQKEDLFSSKVSAVMSKVVHKGKISEVISESSFERVIEVLALRISEEIEKGVVLKRFTQLGALKFERDLRSISEALISHVSNSLGVRAIFARLFQMVAILSVLALEEAHDVWDSFASDASTTTTTTNGNKVGIRAKEKLTAKEVKRVLALRIDFDQREVQRMKLL